MTFKKELYGMYFSTLILTAFTIYFLLVGNYEFLLYTFTLGFLIYLITISDKIFNYSQLAKWGFAVWLFGHLGGGAFKVNGQRLYDTILWDILGDPYFILKYDQAIHVFCYFVITLFIYSIIMHSTKKKWEARDSFVVGLIAFLGGMGVSALNEIIEFSTVVFFGSTGVGGYYNNALDLLFNAVGCLLAIFFMHHKNRNNKGRK